MDSDGFVLLYAPEMKAAIYTGNGRMEVLEKPVPKPSSGEVLLAVGRVGICGSDLLIFQGGMSHRAGPGRILGHEMVAVVAETTVGGIVQAGDRVVVEPTVSCGHCRACRRGLTHVCQHLRFLGIDADGALQQFWAVPANRLHKVPDAILDDCAAMVEPLAVAVHDVHLGAVRAGETVAIIGGGPIGLLIALLAKRAGGKVVVLEINLHRLAFARQLGLDAWNPQERSSVKFLREFTDGVGADVVFEASGSVMGARLMTSLAAIRGRLIIVGIQGKKVPVDLFQVFYRELSVQGTRAYSSEDFKEAIRLISDEEINLSEFISHRYPLRDIQAAMELARSGTPVMKILIDLGSAG